MQAYFPDYLDRGLQIHAYWADCELLMAKDPAAAAAVWEGILKTAAGKYAETWVGYITMLMGAGNCAEARKAYKRVCSRGLEENGRLVLCEAWVRFEREHGTAETLFLVGSATALQRSALSCGTFMPTKHRHSCRNLLCTVAHVLQSSKETCAETCSVL